MKLYNSIRQIQVENIASVFKMNFAIIFFMIFILSADAKSISKRFAATAVSKEKV